MVDRTAAGDARNHGDEPSGNLTEDDMKEQLVLAGALVAPQVGLASESELNNDAARQAASKFPEKFPLPPSAVMAISSGEKPATASEIW